MKIYTRKSSTEGPVSYIADRIKSAARNRLNANRESTLNERLPNRTDHNFYQKATPDELNSAYLKTGQSNRDEFLHDALKARLKLEDFSAGDYLVSKLSKSSRPFSSELFNFLLDWTNKGYKLTEENSKALGALNESYLKTIKNLGFQGLDQTGEDFQFKAIKYFLDRGEDLDILRNDSSWKSVEEMKRSISGMSKEDQDRLKNARISKKSIGQSKSDRDKLKKIKNSFKVYENNPIIDAIKKQNLTDKQLLESFDQIEEIIRSLERNI